MYFGISSRTMQKLGISGFFNTLILIILLLLSAPLNGQHYLLSNKPQLNQKKSLYHLPIGENEFGTYTMNYVSMYLKDGFSLEWYDAEMGVQEDRFIDVAKRSWVLRVWVADSTVCWLTAIKKRRQGFFLYLNKLPSNLKGEIQTQLLQSIAIKEINSDDIIVRNHPRDFSFVLGYIKKEKTGTSVNFLRFSPNGILLNDLNKDLPYEMNSIYWEDLELASFSGESFMGLMHITKPKEMFKSTRQSIYLAIGHVESTFTSPKISIEKWGKNRPDRLETHKLSVEEKWKNKDVSDSLVFFETNCEELLQKPILNFNPQNSCWVISGLWGNIKSESKGYWIWQIFRDSNENSVVNNFSLKEYTLNASKILDGIIKRRKKVDPENYIARRLIFQADGSMVILLERFVELKQLETYYINGIPQTATKILYNYNEIGLLFVNKELNIDTCLRIDKEQTASPNTAYLLGFGSFICEDGIHLLYNADISKDNDVLDVIVRPNYEIITRTLINSDHVYSVMVPMDGKETNYCTFTVPLLKDKQWFWMKVIDYVK